VAVGFLETVPTISKCCYISILALAVILFFPHSFVQAQPNDIASNTIFFELGSNGILYSINYDRLITKSFSIRIGYAYYTISNSSIQFDATVIPIIANYLYGDGNSKLELGAGITFVPTTSIKLSGFIFGSNTVNPGPIRFLTSVIAYRYHPIEGGLNFRIGLTPTIGLTPAVADDKIWAWPCVSVGWTFN
jgi:hypothetical protein